MQRQLSLYTVHGMRRTEPAPPAVRRRRPQGRRPSALADHLVVRRDLEDKIARSSTPAA